LVLVLITIVIYDCKKFITLATAAMKVAWRKKPMTEPWFVKGYGSQWGAIMIIRVGRKVNTDKQ
jgi:hypothetical protein